MNEKPIAEQVVVDITISASVEEVWKAVRDPAAIANWFGWESKTLREEIDYIFISHASADEQARSLRFAEWENVSHRLELIPQGEGTRLRLVISGAPEMDWTGVYEDFREGWVTFFHQLRFALDRHKGQLRRTFYLSGTSRAWVGDTRHSLGLGDILAKAAGCGYAAQTAIGELSGYVWHKTHFQVGLTVAEWGNGLLVVTDKGAAPGQPQHSGSVLATTYGLGGDEFVRLQERWKAWWSANYSAPVG